MIWWQREISLDPITLYGGLVWIKFSAAPLYCMVFSPRRQCFSLELICVRTQIKHSACFSLSSFSTVGFFGKTKKGKKNRGTQCFYFWSFHAVFFFSILYKTVQLPLVLNLILKVLNHKKIFSVYLQNVELSYGQCNCSCWIYDNSSCWKHSGKKDSSYDLGPLRWFLFFK